MSVGDITFGIALPMAGRNLDAGHLLRELEEEVVAAEAAGLDLCLVPEHHEGPDGSLSNPQAVVPWLLARTSRIRIGPGVLLLPLYPPTHVAEWAAILQHASGGRVVLGVGAGYQEADFLRFGVERSTRVPRLEAGLRQLRSAWDPGSSEGERIIPTLEPVPPPPIWLGAWSRPGVERAAALADGWIADPIRTVDEVSEMTEWYRRATADLETLPHVVVMRELWVDESDDRARKRYAPVIEPIYRYYLQRGALTSATSPAPESLKLGAALDERVVWGGVESVVDQLVNLINRTDAQTYVFGLRHPGGPPHEEVLAAVGRLGHQVIPRVRERLRPKQP